jgi:hypothetical protein
MSNAGASPNPWEECARLDYGGDRSFASVVRAQVVGTPPDLRARTEERLLKSLATPGRTDAGLAFICEMLSFVGSTATVSTLAPLLRDPKTTDAARLALEHIRGAEADAALREALAALTGIPKAGLIGSIAMRGDASVRPALAALKDTAGEPAIVRETAARALEHLAVIKA